MDNFTEPSSLITTESNRTTPIFTIGPEFMAQWYVFQANQSFEKILAISVQACNLNFSLVSKTNR